MILDAPAKINLSLRVLRRREDGFHEIATRMAPLELADRISLTLLPTPAPPGTVQFTCDDPTVPADETNLAVKAVRALESHTGPLPGVAIHLEKRIPHGAGLGGGSSDAATVLKGLNALCSLGLSTETLARAAASIGSDIPFFLYDSVCDCGGRGEAVVPVPGFDWHPRLLLIKPPFGVPTPAAYRRWRDSQEVPGFSYAPQSSPGGVLDNDLERPVFEKYPVLGTLKNSLLATPGIAAALMSGSGSTVFAVLTGTADSDAILRTVKEEVGEEVWTAFTSLR